MRHVRKMSTLPRYARVCEMRTHTVQTNTQWKMCGNTPRYPMWYSLGINAGQVKEASLDVLVSCVQEIPPSSADDHLCRCWKASTCSEQTSDQVSQHYNQRCGTRSGSIASFKCCGSRGRSPHMHCGPHSTTRRSSSIKFTHRLSCLAIQLARTQQSPHVGTQSRLSVSRSARA